MMRGLLYLDAVLALITAAYCVFAPDAYVAMYYREPAGAIGLDFVRDLGTVYALYAVLEIGGLTRGDRGFWRVFLPAAVFGDLTHVATFVMGMAKPSAYWGVSGIVNLVYVAAYVPLKLHLYAHPERLERSGAQASIAGTP